MSRPFSMSICALNITIHPHTMRKYVELFKKANEIKAPIRVRGNEYMLLGSLHERHKDSPNWILNGEVFKYLQLDQNDDWYNIAKKNAATEDDLNKIKIPEELKPHFSSFSYVFYPVKHKIVIAVKSLKGKTISPRILLSFFTAFLKRPELLKAFEDINVTLESSHFDMIETFKKYKVKTATIVITRPNPDDNSDLDEIAGEILGRDRLRKLTMKLDGERASGIVLSEDTKTLVKVAASNGSVSAIAKNDNEKPVTISSLNLPVLHSYNIIDKAATIIDSILENAPTLFKKLRS